MRNFNQIYLLFFIVFYISITIGGYFNLKTIFSARRFFKISFWLIQFLLVVSFVALYIYPLNPTTTSNYNLYFLFNSILLVDLITKLPISISSLFHLIFTRKKNTLVLLIIGFIISSSIAFTLIYGLTAGRKTLRTKEVEIVFQETLPHYFENFKIVQISDIHLGSFKQNNSLLKNTILEINKRNPDLVLFTGDLVNNFANEVTDERIQIFQLLEANNNCYSILGNHDYGNYTSWKTELKQKENFEAIVNAHEKVGFKLLRNENTIIKSGTDSIFLIGVENWGHPPFPQYANLEKAMSGIPESSFKILLTHDPAHWNTLVKNKKNIQLTLSGHTHGLQWGLKPGGIPFSLSYLIRENWGGLYKTGITNLYVNTGLGTVGIPYRIDMPAEITVITLKSVKVD